MRLGWMGLLTATNELPEEEKGPGWSWPNWGDLLNPLRSIFEEAGEKMDRITTTVSDVMSGQFLKDAIDNLIVLWVDETYAPLYDVFGKIYLFTPRLAELDFVRNLWSVVSILCIILLVAGGGILAFQMIKGKKAMRGVLKVFIIGLVASMLSFTVLNVLQVFVNYITHSVVESILETSGIDYSHLGGEDILKAIVIGSDAITEPEYASFTLGQLIKDQGGLLNLILYSLFVVGPMWIIIVIKLLVLIVMVAFVGGWLTQSVYTGKLETLVGYLNLYLRTLLLGGIMTLHWTLLVKGQTDYLNGEGFFSLTGISPIQISPISMCIFYIIFYYFWLRPVWRAMRQPISLNGGETVEKVGKWSERASLSMQAIGKRLGSDMLQRKGLDVGTAAKRMQAAGQRMKQMSRRSLLAKQITSKATGGVSEALAGVNYELPKQWAEEAGMITTVQARPITYQGTHIKSEPHEVAHKLGAAGFTAAQILQVPDRERKDMQVMLATGLQQKYGTAIRYQPATGQLMLSGKGGQAALKELRESHFSTHQIKQGHEKDGVFVQQDGQIMMLAHDDQAKAALKSAMDKLPTYTKADLSKEEAKEAYTRLTHDHKDKPWSKKIQLRGDELWIPESLVGELTPILQSMRKTDVTKVRINMPHGSAFLNKMVEDFKTQGDKQQLVMALEPNLKGNYVMVQQEQVEAFYKAYESYRNSHIPYYRTRNQQVKVIKDGIPVDYGAVPLNGMDMGSFEDLQKEALRQHTNQENR